MNGLEKYKGGVMETMNRRTLALVDGENLVFRFQDMIEKGKKKNKATYHELDAFVWMPRIFIMSPFDIFRVSYYTTVVGDELRVKEMNELIAKQGYHFHFGRNKEYQGTLNPHVFKKDNKSRKTRAVDINITIDALTHVYNKSADIIFIISGDGDFLPLINEIKRMGKLAIVGALSEGLEDELKYTADRFYSLDHYFFGDA